MCAQVLASLFVGAPEFRAPEFRALLLWQLRIPTLYAREVRPDQPRSLLGQCSQRLLCSGFGGRVAPPADIFCAPEQDGGVFQLWGDWRQEVELPVGDTALPHSLEPGIGAMATPMQASALRPDPLATVADCSGDELKNTCFLCVAVGKPVAECMIEARPCTSLLMGKGTASHSADCSRISLISNQGDLCTVHFCLYGLCTILV